uniref:Uncharacterized protein n=1 Tax=Rhipicephalus zambeziensis TaxID=60191 RepID=A0A224YAZ9_9ACAR
MKGRLQSQTGHVLPLKNIVPQLRPCFPRENHKKQHYIIFYGTLFIETQQAPSRYSHLFNLCSAISCFCTCENVSRFMFTSQSKWRLRL